MTTSYDLPSFQAITVDPDAAVRSALERRTDLKRTVKSLEVDDLQVKFLKNQTLPDVTANFDYGLSGLGGLQLVRGVGPFGPGSGAVVGENGRSFAATMGDLFANRYPAWTASVNVTYPSAPARQASSPGPASKSQTQTQLKSQRFRGDAGIREAGADQPETRGDHRAALVCGRPEAEQRKFRPARPRASSCSSPSATWRRRATQLKAILDYAQSVVDLETVQEVPLTGGTVTTAAR
jgi:outer membrane protein TolC